MRSSPPPWDNAGGEAEDAEPPGEETPPDDPLALAQAARAQKRSARRLFRLLSYSVRLAWRADRKLVTLTTSLQLISGLISVAQILIIKLVLDAIISTQESHTSIDRTFVPVGLLALVIAVTTVISAVQQQWQRLLGELVSRQTWEGILDVSSSVGLRQFEASDFYDQLQRVQTNAVMRPFMLTQALVAFVGGLASSLGLSVAVVAIQPLLLPLLLLSGIPLYVATRRSGNLEFAFAVAQTPRLRLRQYLVNVQTGRDEAKEVRAFGIAGVLRERYELAYGAFVSDLRRHIRRRSVLAFVSSVASAVVLAGTIFAIIWLVAHHHLSLAAAGAAIVAVRLLAGQISSLFTNIQQIFECGLFLQDLDGFLELQGTAGREDDLGEPTPESFSHLVTEDLGYTYPGSTEPALQGVNLEITAGEVIALVGENGSGKTTLAKLLAALYAPESGVIRWDGVDITAYQRSSLRRAIAVIFQDFVRYQLTVRDNIGFGRPDASRDDPRIVAAARHAGSDRFVEHLPLGYDTILSKAFAGGQELSGGQWQRIALARAFYRNSSFVILDEPSAALDPRAEHELFSSLRDVLAGRTVLYISHRLSTVRDADRIYFLAGGQIIESGTHGELMALQGHYSELFSLQAMAYVKDAD